MNNLLPARTARGGVARSRLRRFTQRMETFEEAQAMTEIIKRLRARYPEAGGRTVDEQVTEVHREFDGNPIRDFVPVLVEREAADRLARTYGRGVDVPV
jgi:hypothetical protein